MKVNWNSKYTTIAAYAFIVICSSILLYFATTKSDWIVSSVTGMVDTLQPFIIGGTIAYLLNFVLVYTEEFLSKKEGFKKLKPGAKRGIGLVITYILAGIVTYLFINFVLPQLVESIVGLVNNIPEYLKQATDVVSNVISNMNLEPKYMEMIVDQFNGLVNIVIGLLSGMLPVLGNLAVTITSSILNILIGIIISIYILIDKEKFIALCRKVTFAMFDNHKSKVILHWAKRSNETFGRFISGKLLDSFIIGVLTFVILTIFKMPYTLLISVIVGVTNIIPFFGPFIGGIPATIIILFVSPVKALWFILIIIIIQQIDGNIIGPKILGDSIGIGAFWILFSLLVAAQVMGFVGMVVGVPLFAIFYSIIKDVVESKLAKKGLPTDTEDYK